MSCPSLNAAKSWPCSQTHSTVGIKNKSRGITQCKLLEGFFILRWCFSGGGSAGGSFWICSCGVSGTYPSYFVRDPMYPDSNIGCIEVYIQTMVVLLWSECVCYMGYFCLHTCSIQMIVGNSWMLLEISNICVILFSSYIVLMHRWKALQATESWAGPWN